MNDNVMGLARQLMQDGELSALVTMLREAPDRLADVRDRAQTVDTAEVEAQFAKLDDDEQDEQFHQAMAELAVTCAQIREEPAEGVDRLFGMLRDPYTVEALLLIFENDDHIDPDYSEQVKEFARWQLRYIGIHAIPEAYTQAEREAVAERFGLDESATPDRGGANA